MSSATQSVLTCPDLLVELFGWLNVPTFDKPGDFYFTAHKRTALGRRTLYSAALVCQAFSRYALDELWRRLDSVKPLLSLLPAFRYDKVEESWILSRAVEPEEWQQLTPYTRRIRTLVYDTPMHSSVWWHIRSRHRDVPLLPRLEKLILAHHLATYDLGPVFVLLSPALRDLSTGMSFSGGLMSMEIPTRSDLSAMSLALNTICTLAPDLHHLHLGHTFRLNASRVHALTRLPKLTSLSVCQCKDCAISDLRAFWDTAPVPALLQVLAIAVKGIPEGFTSGGLQLLQKMTICGTAGDVDRFIRGIQPIQLHTVNLQTWRDSEPDGAPISPILSSICRRLPSTIQSLELELDAGSEATTQCPLFPVVAAMHPLKELTSLTLHADALGMSQDNIRILGELLPRLRSLKVTGPTSNRYASGGAPSVTVGGLAEIARAYPALEALSLPTLNARELLSSEIVLPSTSHGLRFLEIEYVYGVKGPSPVAHAIDRLFPNLMFDSESSDYGFVHSSNWYGHWRPVRALLHEMSDARRGIKCVRAQPPSPPLASWSVVSLPELQSGLEGGWGS